jgi:ABC-type bacteriocin/lantibiotic exporter with double-glycine peptidase domain
VDINRISALLYIIFVIITGAVSCILGIAYMMILQGWELPSFLLFGFVSLSSIYIIVYHFRAKYIKKTLQKKDKRMTFFRNVLQNIEAVKIRVLENFYAIRMFEKREDEIKMLKVSVWIVSVVNALNYL